MHVVHRRQSRSDVEELADAHLARQVPDRALQECPVAPHGLGRLRNQPQQFGRHRPVGGKIL
jgi:hypothetical protein